MKKDDMKLFRQNVNWIPWYWWLLGGIFTIFLSGVFRWGYITIINSTNYEPSTQFIIRIILLLILGITVIFSVNIWIKLVVKYEKLE